MTRVLMPASLLYSPSVGRKEAKTNETDVREANEFVRWLWGRSYTFFCSFLAALAEIRSQILRNCNLGEQELTPQMRIGDLLKTVWAG